MKTWKQAFKEAVVIGSIASLTSMAALALHSRRENGSGWATLNAPSHWLRGNPALKQDGPSLRYTATGILIHHLSAGFWGVLHAKFLGGNGQPKAFSGLALDAAATTAVAAVVDLVLVPQRLTPGFQWRLTKPSVATVYALFAIGLVAGSYLTGQRNRQ